MEIQSLSLVNFKNYSQLDLTFDAGLNCLLGDNGEGKTNVLDAIHVLSFCKSYFNPIDSQSIKFEQDFYMVQGEFNKDDAADLVTCSVKRGRKKSFKRNKSEYDRLADHIGRYPVVMVTPYDSNLILGGSDIRRRFMDSIISQYDRKYLQALISYNKVLDQRNAYLKQSGKGGKLEMDVLDVLDQQMVSFGSVISEQRKSFMEEILQPLFEEFYQQLSQGQESVNLTYSSQVNKSNFELKLKESYDKDKITQYTNVGIHKDDLIFSITDHPLKKFGSQGQQKSYLLALKLAYYKCIHQKLQTRPILLLDDIFDKLDRSRVMSLLGLIISEEIGQVFISDTSLERVPEILKELGQSCKVFHIKEGDAKEA